MDRTGNETSNKSEGSRDMCLCKIQTRMEETSYTKVLSWITHVRGGKHIWGES